MRHLMSSCLVGNIFLPGHLTAASVKLQRDGSLFVTGNYSAAVEPLMKIVANKLRKFYRQLDCVLLPKSFTIGAPGSDIHYCGTFPMRLSPRLGQTSRYGEIEGLKGVYIVDGACLPKLSEKSHTLTLMANADRIGRKLALDLTRD
jgi:choline dehydrogenase-like flavoprotein